MKKTKRAKKKRAKRSKKYKSLRGGFLGLDIRNNLLPAPLSETIRSSQYHIGSLSDSLAGKYTRVNPGWWSQPRLNSNS